MRPFTIGDKDVGKGQCYVIAEVGMAHDGSLAQAHAYIDAVKTTGVDAVKFQCHLADAESTPEEEWRVEPEWPQDKNRQEYWRRTEFGQDQWWSLKAHCQKAGVEFLCSPFSCEAVELLEPLVEAWKIPSGEILNAPLLEAVTESGRPVILSSGMATDGELDGTVGKYGWAELAVLQCTSLYPTPADKVGLGMMDVFKARYHCPVGLSDHSGMIYAGLGAAALGADILEVHVCWDWRAGGFDTSSSVTVDELSQLVHGVRFLEKARRQVFKDPLAETELKRTRELFLEKWRRLE